jgi:hypothetical protein
MTRKKTILLSLLLSLPVILFVLQHYFVHSPEMKPTGFTNEENVLYMSYAHQYLDQDKFSLFYSNPFDGDPDSPKIYFQPVNFLFAGLMQLGMDPGLCFSLFGILMAICCIYLGIKILQHLLPDSKKIPITALLFTWGGGLTAFTGLFVTTFFSGYTTPHWIDGIYIADPANGWWGLNWGRTLFIPLEAYYHFLFLLNIYCILKQRWAAASLSALFLTISHPFTGIELLLIINGWLALEKWIFKNRNIPYWYWLSVLLITVVHLWYYLFYLNSFPEHKKLFNQYSEGWTYSLLVAASAYSLVAILAGVNIYINRPIRKLFEIPHQRLFIAWAIIAFLLSKHEWFMKPMQPIHFTRGYVWGGLFLFALPAVQWLYDFGKNSLYRKWLLYITVFIFLSDNLLWTANLLRSKNNMEWEGHISGETRQVLNFLNKSTSPADLVTGNSLLVNYLLHVYTKTNSWVSHPYNTPGRQDRMLTMQQYLETGIKPVEWQNRRIIIVLNKNMPVKILPALQINKVFENSLYTVFIP